MKTYFTKSSCGRILSRQVTLLFLTVACFIISTIFVDEVKAQSTSHNWNNVAIGGGGFVSAIITSKIEQGLIYARTDVGGAYRWDVANSKWIPLLDWVSEAQTGYLGVESLAIDPQNPNRVYMLVGIDYFNSGKSAILRSNDYGETFSITDVTAQFKAHGNGMGRQNGEKLVVDPNNANILFTGTRRNGLFKSTNAGVSWSRVSALNVTDTPNDNGISLVVMDPSSASAGSTQTIFVGVSRTGTNLYRSNNGGQSFSAIPGAPSNLMPTRAVLASDGNLYINYANGAGPHGHWSVPEPMDQGQIWKFNTSTGSWTNITPSGITSAFGGISVDPNNPNRVLASTVNTYLQQDNAWGDRIFLSTNGGSSWTDVIARGFDLDPNGTTWIDGHSIHWAGSIEFDPFDTKKAWVTSGNGVFMTENIDASTNVWKFTVKGLEETVPLDMVSIPGGPVISVIGDYDGFRHTDVTKYAPIHTPRMGTTSSVAYAAQNPNIMLRSGGKLYYSTNMGVSWTESSSLGAAGLNPGRVAISADGNVFLHTPQENTSTTTYRSTNRGSSWASVSGLNFTGAMPVADPENVNKFYAYNSGNGTMMVSTNKGTSFSSAGSVGTGGSKIIRTVPGKEGHIWVALYEGGLSRSTNSGQSFTKISGVSGADAVGVGKAAEGSSYPTIFIWGTINGITGIYRSTDQGSNWTRVNDDAHEYGGPGNGQFVVGDMNVFGRVYMSTAGRGIVYGEPGGSSNCTPTAITPYVQVNGGSWSQTATASLSSGGTVKFGPQPATGGSWMWNGPNGFSATTREITFSDIQNNQGGNYIATYTNTAGCQSTRTFTITVTGGTVGNTITNGTYIITARHSSKALDPDVANNGNIIQMTNNGAADQKWDITSLGGGYYSIVNDNTGKALDVEVSSGNILEWTYHGGTNQQWQINNLGNGYYSLINRRTGQSVDIAGASTADGANVLQYTYNASNNQQFSLIASNGINSSGKDLVGNQLQKKEAAAFRIYPNPSASGFNIEVGSAFTYTIVDQIGRTVETGGGEQSVSAGSTLASGIYLIRVQFESDVKQFKVIKN